MDDYYTIASHALNNITYLEHDKDDLLQVAAIAAARAADDFVRLKHTECRLGLAGYQTLAAHRAAIREAQRRRRIYEHEHELFDCFVTEQPDEDATDRIIQRAVGDTQRFVGELPARIARFFLLPDSDLHTLMIGKRDAVKAASAFLGITQECVRANLEVLAAFFKQRRKVYLR